MCVEFGWNLTNDVHKLYVIESKAEAIKRELSLD